MVAGLSSCTTVASWARGMLLPSGVGTGIWRMLSMVSRRSAFQRTVRSNIISPSWTWVTAWPPMAAWMMLATSPVFRL